MAQTTCKKNTSEVKLYLVFSHLEQKHHKKINIEKAQCLREVNKN